MPKAQRTWVFHCILEEHSWAILAVFTDTIIMPWLFWYMLMPLRPPQSYIYVFNNIPNLRRFGVFLILKPRTQFFLDPNVGRGAN